MKLWRERMGLESEAILHDNAPYEILFCPITVNNFDTRSSYIKSHSGIVLSAHFCEKLRKKSILRSAGSSFTEFKLYIRFKRLSRSCTEPTAADTLSQVPAFL